MIDTFEGVENFAENMHDPIWRICNLYTIIDKRGNKIPFRPWEEQLDFLRSMHTRNVILKARQRGFTTLCCIMYLDDCLFNDNVRAAVIAHKLDDASIIFRDRVKEVYLSLPESFRKRVSLKQDSSTMLTFSNGSSIRVSTSTRSGTVQWLHVSEYGKICSQYPDKAREIRTGAFPSAEQGVITIESTAEGNSGDFYEKSMDSMHQAEEMRDLSRLDYKFFFYPWWRAKEYQVKQTIVPESPEDTKYFNRLEGMLGITLTQPQRNWWLVQEKDLGGDMKREYPATPEEAFEQAIEGAYFADQIAAAYKHGRVGRFPVDPAYRVDTFWDLGRNDDNVIWLRQLVDNLNVFVGFYRSSGEWIGHYIKWLEEWAEENDAILGEHYLPHDGDVKTIWTPGGSLDTMATLNFYPNIVRRPSKKIEPINAMRRLFTKCAFDEQATKDGLDLLKRYRKEYDERNDIYKNVPVHDESSHVADALMTFALSDASEAQSPVERTHKPRYGRGRRHQRDYSNLSHMAS